MENRSVFYDPSGKRRKWLIAGLIGAGGLGVWVAAVFVLSVLAMPRKAAGAHHPKWSPIPAPQRDRRLAERELVRAKQRLNALAERRPAGVSPHDHVSLAFYAPWQESGLASFRNCADHLSDIAPVWLQLKKDGTLDDASFQDNPGSARTLQDLAVDHGVRIVPVLTNSFDGFFDPKAIRSAIGDPSKRRLLASQTADWVAKHGGSGVNVDFESIPKDLEPAWVSFVAELKERVKGSVSVDVESDIPLPLAQSLSEVCDYLVPMIYDEHGEDGDAGPIASVGWSADVLGRLLSVLPEDKVVGGIGSYAYDTNLATRTTESLTFEEAMANAAGYRDGEKPEDVIRVDPESVNPTFRYRDDAGKPHAVWMLDALTAYNQWRMGRQEGIRGEALWLLGSEDPSVWTFLDRNPAPLTARPAGLGTIEFPYEIDTIGRGEVLSVKASPQSGARTVEFDPASGDAADWNYTKYAFPYVLQKTGYQPKKLVLTFDDGPSAEYTGRILDTLEELKVPAAFFVIGKNAESNPGVVRRMVDDGFEIGNHSFTHPNLGVVSTDRAEVEINATQRAIESIAGVSTRLFRPPYNADSEPSTREEMAPVAIADRLGYLTIGENVDPTDWDTVIRNPDGTTRAKTAQDISDFVLEDLERRERTNDEGNIILLHDAGGDREATIGALRRMVPELRRRGYEFTNVAGLLKMPESQLMPPIPPADRRWVGLDRFVFESSYLIDRALFFGSVGAILIGLGRMVFVLVAAGIDRRRTLAGAPLPTGALPTASAIIAAYNEEKVIGRTIESMLASKHPFDEILVVDDGSKDGTYAEALKAAEGHPTVRVVTKENGGKASAINVGLELTTAEVYVGLDADTQLDPDALERLLRPFAQPGVVAVAGNVRVGNRGPLLARWQEMEYTISQNMDRRAFGLLNAIAVVPGAIGAWRTDAVKSVGGYRTDTLAEDMDLTWRLRETGGRIVNEPDARAYTEVPETLNALVKQRFRWSYGTLQCLWKHRSSLFRYGAFGWIALPSFWLLYVGFQLLAPAVELGMLMLLLNVFLAWIGPLGGSLEFRSLALALEPLRIASVLYLAFLLLEAAIAWVAYGWEGLKRQDLWTLPFQRVVYRQMMLAVMLKSLWVALTGLKASWGKLARTGNVKMGS